MNTQTQEALKMVEYAIYDMEKNDADYKSTLNALYAAKEKLSLYQTTLEAILHGTLLDKNNRDEDGMLDAKQWGNAQQHLIKWIGLARKVLPLTDEG